VLLHRKRIMKRDLLVWTMLGTAGCAAAQQGFGWAPLVDKELRPCQVQETICEPPPWFVELPDEAPGRSPYWPGQLRPFAMSTSTDSRSASSWLLPGWQST
jgi:hypothetical protein